MLEFILLEDTLLEEGCWDVELFNDAELFSFDLSLIDEFEVSCIPLIGFLLKFDDDAVCYGGFVA
jgi:hypothetical protein